MRRPRPHTHTHKHIAPGHTHTSHQATHTHLLQCVVSNVSSVFHGSDGHSSFNQIFNLAHFLQQITAATRAMLQSVHAYTDNNSRLREGGISQTRRSRIQGGHVEQPHALSNVLLRCLNTQITIRTQSLHHTHRDFLPQGTATALRQLH